MDYKKPQSTIVHGGAGIYPLTTADQVILADGSRLEKDGKINVDSAADSSKLGGKAPEYYIQPRNLLDNSDFTNPVNQRGKTSYTAQGYTIDRWYSNNANKAITLSNTGITLSTGSTLFQKLDLIDALAGKTITAAVCFADGTIAAKSGISTNNGAYTSIVDVTQNNLRIRMYEGTDGYIRFQFEANANIKLQWVALYEGSYTADTLPPYVPKGYAAEFAECRRYYKRFTSPNAAIICAGYVTSSTKCIYINALDNYPMRIVKPSCSFSGNITVRGINGYIAEDYSDVVIRVYANATGCISMIEITRGDSAAWNATNNTPLSITINANSVFELIADL